LIPEFGGVDSKPVLALYSATAANWCAFRGMQCEAYFSISKEIYFSARLILRTVDSLIYCHWLILNRGCHKIIAGHLLPAPSAEIGMVKARHIS
jgi:hypothetical protein